MLTDSSLTNILVVSGVSQIRYRVYNQHVTRKSLDTFWGHLPSDAVNKDMALLKAYTEMIAHSIPAFWRIRCESTEPGRDLELELWVFWFDERHTGKIDANDNLYALDESKVGSFTWENAYSKIQSPTASPGASSTQSNTCLPITVSDEYKWFIKSVRNLIHVQMKKNGSFPLGEFYIFPNADQDVIADVKANSTLPQNLAKLTNSVLCCSYSIYLASTNLIFQPNTRRMRLRPITIQTIRNRGKKVIISPTGETMMIANNAQPLSPQIEEMILKKWSLMLDIPYTRLIQCPPGPNASNQQQQQQQQQQPKQPAAQQLPNLVAIKSTTSVDESYYYPSCLIFLSSSSRISPNAMAGVNGLFAFNQGFSEDLGDKWQRWAWGERISNFWEYACPRESTTTVVLDTLSLDNGQNSNAGLLQKAINEPVIASPLMVTKSVATPGSATGIQRTETSTPSSSSNTCDDDDQQLSLNQHQQSQQQLHQKSKPKHQAGLSLVDFAMENFSMPNSTDDLVEYPILPNHASVANQPNLPNDNHNQPGMQQQQQQQHQQQYMPQQPQQQPQQQHPLQQELHNVNPNHSNMAAVSNNVVNNSGYQSPQMTNLGLDAYEMVESMDVDSMVLDMPGRWGNDGMDDLDSFDFGVTDADFDFFESSGPTTTAPAPPQSTALLDDANILNEIPKDDLLQDVQPDRVDVASEFKQDLMDLDRKQQQDMLDTDLDQQQQHDMSVTPLQVSMAQHDQFDSNKVFEHIKQEQGAYLPPPPPPPVQPQYYQQQLFVPPQFAPIKLASVVNDAKYIQGGKFTYPAQDTPLSSKRRQNKDYRPDYIPLVRSSKRNKRKSSKMLLLDTINKENKPLELFEHPNSNNEQQITSEPASIQSIQQQISSSPEGGEDEEEKEEEQEQEQELGEEEEEEEESSLGGDSSEEDDDDDQDVDNESNHDYDDGHSAEDYNDEDISSKITRTMDSLSLAQSKFVGKLTRLDADTETMKTKTNVDQIMMDYDSPFARSVTDSVIRVAGARIDINELEETKALDYLCQQAVMGGYPFSGGIEAMSSNGFEANEGESAKVVIARRRNLLQKYNGDTIHVPSTPSDVEYMNQSFKNVLADIFNQQKKSSTSELDAMCIDSLPLPATLTVKGPLNVQDYYELSETNQAHSKYGKYQVKKRRPAEPNLGTLQPPNITVNRQDDIIEGTFKLIMFWEKLRLEPYSSKKQVSYFVVYPQNESIETSVAHFFKGLSTVYETCQLGVHHPGNAGPYRKGLVPVPLLPQLEDESFQGRQLRSYMAECHVLGSTLGSAMAENMHIVIYMINPSTHLASHLDLSRCFSKMKAAYNASAPALGPRIPDKIPARLVLQLMPIEHVLRATSFGGCVKFGMKEVAFSVYSKCHTIVSRQHQAVSDSSRSVSDLYAPPFVLSKPISSQIHFKLKKAISAFPTILESHAVLHMGYAFSMDKRWMIIVWTDNQGEMIEFAVLDNHRHNLPLSSVFEEAWSRTKQISRRTGFAWTFVVCKMGLIFEDELGAWISCLPSNEQVAIVSLDVESTLYVNTTNVDTMMNDMHAPTDVLNTNAPSMMNAATSTKKIFSDTSDNGQTKALLLNHRVAYSNKRERMSLGILGLDSISREDWMIPLASGYMIHTPPTTENPNNELFNCNPLVLEIHLVYNQTNHSAYSTLRDIVKKYHALSFVNVMPSNSNCFPIHLALVERLSRILLVVN
ncbi:mediator complex subunit 13 C-terminal-domain-containing protein [Parasitella parasitica]|nr:mediator complex subunit 13 C-terminal-domain-containing protein [Parasitella parasitica]